MYYKYRKDDLNDLNSMQYEREREREIKIHSWGELNPWPIFLKSNALTTRLEHL